MDIDGPETAVAPSSPTPRFEPMDGDTYFGADLPEKLNFQLPGDPIPAHPRLERPGLERPTLPDNQRLERLDPQQKDRLLPAPGVTIEMPRPTRPDGSDALILVDTLGRAHHLPASGTVEAIRTDPPLGRPYYTIRHQDGTTEDIPRDLARGFRYRAGANGQYGTLRWNVPGGGVRFLSNHAGRVTMTTVSHGATLVARPGNWPWRLIKQPNRTVWEAVNAPHSVVPQLPTLVTRHDTPLLGPDGLSKSHEARQGEAGNCFLVAPMKHMAENIPPCPSAIPGPTGDPHNVDKPADEIDGELDIDQNRLCDVEAAIDALLSAALGDAWTTIINNDVQISGGPPSTRL
jgi:hypothetical protein